MRVIVRLIVLSHMHVLLHACAKCSKTAIWWDWWESLEDSHEGTVSSTAIAIHMHPYGTTLLLSLGGGCFAHDQYVTSLKEVRTQLT